MNTRISLQSVINQALADTRRLSDQLISLQTQASTGKKFAQISDNPTATIRLLNTETQIQTYATHLENNRFASARLNSSVSSLQSAAELFSRAITVGIEASHSVNDPSAFEALAQSIDAMLDQLLSLANARDQGGYVFGGAVTDAAPFAVTATDSQGRPREVQYQGGADGSTVFVDQNRQVVQAYAGDAIFMARQRQATRFTGHTGARPGSGTDSGVGRDHLLIQHTATTFAPGSGVQAGDDSILGDTILGPLGRHRLHITDSSGTGTAGTVSLDGGAPVAYTSADTNLRVTNAAGDVIYLNMTAITPNFDGDVDIAGDGTLSVDGGLTSAALTFTANQGVIDAESETVTFVDTTLVERTGVEAIEYPGTYDAFQALITLRDDLRNTRDLSDQDQILAISGHLAELERVHGNILNAVGIQSSTLESLQSLQTYLEDLHLTAQQTASDLGDADLSELVIKLQTYQNMLSLSFATFSRIVDQNLLDFLR